MPPSVLDKKLPAPLVGALAAMAMKLHGVASQIDIDDSRLRMVLGVALADASAVVAVAAFTAFWRARTTINPLQPQRASQLVTHGIYRLSRNPMYLSLLLLLVAYAVRLGDALSFAGPALYAVCVTRFQILPEERALAARFGPAYDAYRRRTRRWLGVRMLT